MARLFQFRCKVCQHEDDLWVNDPTETRECPGCGQASFTRVFMFSALRSAQECPPGAR